jgi:hypothetical protein
MHRLRLLIIAIAVICVLALAAFALVEPQAPGDDLIIIKGGSLYIECGNKNDADCMPYDSATKKYKHKKGGGKIEMIVIKDSEGNVLQAFTRKANFPDGKPSVEISYK